MALNFSGYVCERCGLSGDLLIHYGTLAGREEALGQQSEVIAEEKKAVLKFYNQEVSLKKANGSTSLEALADFDDLGWEIIDRIRKCKNCKQVYHSSYKQGYQLGDLSKKA